MRLPFLLLTCCALQAAEPTLTHVHPAAVQRGTEADVKFTGKFTPWPCKVWTDAPGIVFTAGKDAGKFHVAVAADVAEGPHLIRAFNDEGASAPISLIVASTPQTAETEPNDDFRKPQVLNETTCVINGIHEKADDVDSLAIALKKGQTLVTWVEAYVLAAGFDAMLRIVDEGGQTLAFNHDFTTMDPFIAFTAPQDGRYVIQTMGHKYPAASDVRFAGGEDCVYRLHLSTGAYVRNTWPLLVQRGNKTQVGLEGWNLPAPTIEIDPAVAPAFPVELSDIPEFIETAEPQTLPIPSGVSGRIVNPGAKDRYQFTTTKGAVLEFNVTGLRFGSEIDAWLKILNQEGKEIATNDDADGSSDPRLVWTVPADGTFTALVGDLTQRGGQAFYYRLQISPVVPSASGVIANHSAKVESGKSTEIKVTVTLKHGYQKKLKLAAKNLPAGTNFAEVEVPEKGGEVKLSITAEPTAQAASQPFQLVLREVEGGAETPVVYSMVSTTENNGVPQGYRQLLINTTPELWLTVIVPPPPKPADPPPPVPPAK